MPRACSTGLFLLPSLLFSFVVFAQDDSRATWEKYMTPGAVHQMISASDGVWQTYTSLWLEPAKEPVKSSGTCTMKMILGGRYQESRFNGNFMGMPMEGIGTLAYDNAKETFYSTWIDNMGTGIMNMEGKWDEPSKTIRFVGKSYDPMLGKDVVMKENLRFADSNHQFLEMFMVDDGGNEMKTMEIIFTRK